MKIDIIAGARPNFMKIAPIIEELEKTSSKNQGLSYRLIHTGQHYDKNMSEQFFEELRIPKPNINLGAGGGTQAEQTAAIMIGYEKLLITEKSDLCMVVGDVTSTMACSIVAKKMQIPVAHIEAGIRSGDMNMPEEINRIVTDSITDYFFTTTANASQYLKNLGISESRIFTVGNTMIDTLLKNVSRLKKPSIWHELNLTCKEYLVLTLHRPSNVDEENKIKIILDTIIENSKEIPIIFPIHPRTRKVLNKINFNNSKLKLVEPLGYLEFNYLVKHSLGVLTDSGGITEETTVLNVPCMTLRDSTERPETVHIGTNELLGTDPKNIRPALELLFSNNWKKGDIPELWDGNTSQRIVSTLMRLKVD